MPDESTSDPRATPPWWRWAFASLSTLGLALSLYLGWHFLAGGAVIGCGGGSACDQVLGSRWSSVGGLVPVSGLAAGAYLALLVAGFFIGSSTEAPVRRMAWRAMLVLVGAIAGSAIWFIVVQKWIVGSFCPYCMAAHVNGLLLTILVAWQGSRQREAPTDLNPAAQAEPAVLPAGVRPFPVIGPVSIGMAAAAIMAVCQATIAPPPEYRAGQIEKDSAAVDLRTAPMVGSPEATNVVSLLFDYKCRHCQKLHFMLGETVRRFEGTLAFALCPTPLNNQCNPYVLRDVEEFRDSCELARIALAVWVARREAFHDFELWMFSMESGDFWRPRRPDAARARAIELVGRAGFEAAQSDPWIDRYLHNCIELYGRTAQAGNTTVPKMVSGSQWVVPQPNDVDELVQILHDSLGLAVPELKQP